jgi:Na+(H+)/acetate symporter ActP
MIQQLQNFLIPAVSAKWIPKEFQDSNPNDLVKSFMNLALTIVLISGVIYIIFSGMQYISSGGDAQKTKAAMSSITNAIIGIVVAFAAYVIVNLVMNMVFERGIDELPTTLIFDFLRSTTIV